MHVLNMHTFRSSSSSSSSSSSVWKTETVSCAAVLVVFFFLLLPEFAASSQTQTPSTASDSIPSVFNSSLSCTRGETRTNHDLDCKKELPFGLLAVIAVRRLFNGATPKSSGCDRKAPYANCCQRDPDKPDCVFSSNKTLDDIISKCSGTTACNFAGRLVSTQGDCDPALYPEYTSFSFIEFECIRLNKLNDFCPAEETSRKATHIFLDSNHHHSNFDLQFETCDCILFTKCGERLVFEALYVRFRKVNTTECVEEITFQDMKDSRTNKSYTCADKEAMSNEIMFTSTSNAAKVTLNILDKHVSSVLISVTSSDPTSVVTLNCGHEVSTNTLPSNYYCPGEDTPPPPTKSTTTPSTSPTSTMHVGNGGDQGRVVLKEKDDLGIGGIAGISLAAVGILLVLSQVIFFLFRRRRKQNSEQDEFVVRYNNHIPSDYAADDQSEYSQPTDYSYAAANGGHEDEDEKYEIPNMMTGIAGEIYQRTIVTDGGEDVYLEPMDKTKYSGDPPPYTEHDED